MKFPDKPERNNTDVYYGVGIAIAAMLLLPAWIFIAVLVKAWVVSMLWHWYIVSFFHQPELPLTIAFGISLIISYLIPSRDLDNDKSLSEQILYAAMFPAATLIFGWLGTFFI
jgi:hypothetical protein